MSDMKELAAMLLKELAPALGAIVKAEVAAHVKSAPLAAVAAEVIDAGVAFAERNPGIGNVPPTMADVVALPAAASDVNVETNEAVGDLDVTGLNLFCRALNAKVDALVQATGHGNSAAMAAHT